MAIVPYKGATAHVPGTHAVTPPRSSNDQVPQLPSTPQTPHLVSFAMQRYLAMSSDQLWELVQAQREARRRRDDFTVHDPRLRSRQAPAAHTRSRSAEHRDPS